MINNEEPSLEKIEDFNGRGSEEKKRTVNLVIVASLFVGAIYTVVKVNYSTVSDQLNVQDGVAITIK
ncbi:MAG TPA: hypothetical protein EYG75_04895 [Campylobacterales bacterium]|nr:hypothetical protein [Campylobacterales bacterium]